MKTVVSAYVVRWNMVLGFIFVAIITFMPEGLVPGSARLWRWAWRRNTSQKTTPQKTGSAMQGDRP
jgi:branched-chain amino acid transport system permease protein